MSHVTSDSSEIIQAQIGLQISSQMELLFGVDKFAGADNSEMGRFKDASRVWVMLRAFFKK